MTRPYVSPSHVKRASAAEMSFTKSRTNMIYNELHVIWCSCSTGGPQEPLKPAHTNNTPNEPPKGDDKKVKNGGESRDASGSKGGGRAKKAGGLKSKGGKQSSMMSFFKKA